MRPKTLYGWFSQKALRQGAPSSFYGLPEGGEIEVTLVTNTKDHEILSDQYFDDVVFVGEVTNWLRAGQVFRKHGERWA